MKSLGTKGESDDILSAAPFTVRRFFAPSVWRPVSVDLSFAVFGAVSGRLCLGRGCLSGGVRALIWGPARGTVRVLNCQRCGPGVAVDW
ncbi:hypothetical protein JCM16814_24870 [Desulfobaculum senezii]